MGRPVPTGNGTNEWRLWLFENAAAGAGYLAEQIAAAIGKTAAEAKPKPVGRSDEPTNLTTNSWPRITNRSIDNISPWVGLIAIEVEFSSGAERQVYHSFMVAGAEKKYGCMMPSFIGRRAPSGTRATGSGALSGASRSSSPAMPTRANKA
jgi:hypothetical protein